MFHCYLFSTVTGIVTPFYQTPLFFFKKKNYEASNCNLLNKILPFSLRAAIILVGQG